MCCTPRGVAKTPWPNGFRVGVNGSSERACVRASHLSVTFFEEHWKNHRCVGPGADWPTGAHAQQSLEAWVGTAALDTRVVAERSMQPRWPGLRAMLTRWFSSGVCGAGFRRPSAGTCVRPPPYHSHQPTNICQARPQNNIPRDTFDQDVVGCGENKAIEWEWGAAPSDNP